MKTISFDKLVELALQSGMYYSKHFNEFSTRSHDGVTAEQMIKFTDLIVQVLLTDKTEK